MKRIVLLALCAACTLSDPPETGTSTGEVDVTWTDAVGVATAGNSLTKTGATGWNAGAASAETIAGDGYVEFTTGESTTAKMAGLSVGNAGQHHSDIDFAFYLKASGVVGVYEGGVQRDGNVGTYAAGDVFRVEVGGGEVTYALNGSVVYTSAVAPGSPLRVDTSLNTPGATISDVELVATGLTWQNLVGVAAAGGDLTKTSTSAGWNAGASSVETIAGAGFVEFTAGEATTSRMAGLGNGDASQHHDDIEYAVWLKANGTFGVYEGGVLRDGTLGTYGAGDVFRVTVTDDGDVFYSVNGGAPFYISAVAASFPLRVDTSLNTPGATIQDVRLGTGEAPCVGPFVVTDAASRDALAACSQIIGELTINAPGLAMTELPALEMLRGDLTLWTSFHAEALGEIHGHIFGEPNVAVVSLPALVTAYSLHLGRKRSWTETIDLSSLETLTNGGFGISNAKELTTLSLPALRSVSGGFGLDGNGSGFTSTQVVEAPLLESIGGNLVIYSHEVLVRIDFGSLISLGADDALAISGNLLLPSCYPTDILERLQANGWDGEVDIDGNTGTGTCD